ncbi:hypothetical protein Baya_8611 [Bagarius yarrelli]|uniref:Uncharacterized protein n=1 Tax=Bagarius yarrelli TaxID=175774 RepID=A0A556U4G3_BAGYA|nr:hypothetical protein Baya_8611 [Bagarius yarrelli]
MRGLEAEESKSESRENVEPDGDENCCVEKSKTQVRAEVKLISPPALYKSYSAKIWSACPANPLSSLHFLCVSFEAGEGKHSKRLCGHLSLFSRCFSQAFAASSQRYLHISPSPFFLGRFAWHLRSHGNFHRVLYLL